jgi:hypothetical protein
VNEFETIKHIMMKDNVTYETLSKNLGYKSKSSSYITLNNKHIYVDTWRKYLDELGFEIVVRRKSNHNEEYVVSDDNLPSPLRFHDMDLNLESILK